MSIMTTVNKKDSDSTTTKKTKYTVPEPKKGSGIAVYLQGVKAEWGKISWPSRPQIWGQTLVVLFMVSIMTLGLFVIDNGIHMIISLIVPSR